MSSPTTPQTPDSQSSQPQEEAPKVVAPRLGVRLPKSWTTGSPSSSPTPSPTMSPDGGDAFAPDPIDQQGSTPSLADEPENLVKIDRSAVADIVRGLVASAALFLHRHLTTSDEDTAAGLWIATERDERQIANPVAAIAARHGVPVGKGGQDTADLISMGMGIAAYVVRNARASVQVRVNRRRAEKAGLPGFEAPEPKRTEQQ